MLKLCHIPVLLRISTAVSIVFTVAYRVRNAEGKTPWERERAQC